MLSDRLGLISFRADGERLAHAGERPAFFGLTVDGYVVEYFTTVQALHASFVFQLFRREQAQGDTVVTEDRQAA